MYATEAEFEALIGAGETLALLDLENTGEPVPGRLALALETASADIDAILGARAATFAAERPTFLRTACIHIARWHLSGAVAVENDPIRARHDHYVRLLTDLADGVIGAASGGTGAGEAVMVSAPSVFARPRRTL